LLTNLLQLRRIKTDINLAGTILTVIAVLTGLAQVISMLGLTASATRIALMGLGGTLAAVLGGITAISLALGRFMIFITGATGIFGAFFKIANGIVVIGSRILLPFAAILGVLQLISRARAIADVEDAKDMLDLTPKFATAMAKLSAVVGIFLKPFVAIFDTIARFLSPLFQVSRYFEALVFIIDALGTTLLLAQSTFNGLLFAVFEFVEQVKSFVTGGGFSFSAIGDAFTGGIDDMIERGLQAISDGTGAVVTQTTHIGKVEIRNDFKQQMEPDRIAFTLKEQLLKAAQNPGQAAGRSFTGAFAR
jgi:hypothetical protein